MKETAEELMALAEQHREGAIHTRDLGNPCAGCGVPGPTTMTYCEKCMVAKLAHALGRQLLISKSYEEAGAWLAAELEHYKNLVHSLGMEGLRQEYMDLKQKLEAADAVD